MGDGFDICGQIIISMSKLLLQQLTRLPTLTVKELQSRILAKQISPAHENEEISPHTNTHSLQITSPFYPRLAAHKDNCKCRYHQRQRYPLKKLEKCLTQPNQENLSPESMSNGRNNSMNGLVSIDSGREFQFENWKNELSAEDVKKYYFEYLKTLPSFTKFKRHDKLDCHNTAFEEFLKNHYLVILDRNASKDEVMISKTPHRTMQKVYTEGNIEIEKTQDRKEAGRRQFISSKESEKENEALSARQGRSMKSASKMKKLGFKGTGKNLDLIDEQSGFQRKQRRKRTKFLNTSRPSFFGLIQDQQILRQICLRLANESRLENDEAKQMMRQLAEADIEIYRKVINEMSEDLQSGLAIRSMDQQHTNLLVKIVLHRIQKETKSLKNRDSQYDDKNELIGDLCGKFGWPKEEKIIGLNEFWKIRKSSLKNVFSRKSLHAADSRHRIEKRSAYGDAKADKKIKSKVTIRGSIKDGGVGSTVSGFNVNDGRNGNSKTHLGNSQSHFLNNSKEEKSEDKPIQEFKFKESKKTSKKGVLMRRDRDRFNRKDRTIERDSFKSSSRGRRDNGFARKGTCFFRSISKEDYDVAEKTNKNIEITLEVEGDERSSSMFYGLKGNVQHHIQLNRRFLKKVQHELIDNECQQLVIGISQTILTKKRKIRAIYNALERQEVKQSDYYNDILKYLEIYEEYCDLVVKHKKEGRTKTQIRTQQMVEVQIQKEKDESDIDRLLQDLKKERELKYVDLRTIFDVEDPKEELILKIPQYTTMKNKVETKKHDCSQDLQSNSQQHHKISSHHQSEIAQKDLVDRVHLHCGQQPKNSKSAQLPTEKIQNLHEKPLDFALKLQRYRIKLGLHSS